MNQTLASCNREGQTPPPGMESPAFHPQSQGKGIAAFEAYSCIARANVNAKGRPASFVFALNLKLECTPHAAQAETVFRFTPP